MSYMVLVYLISEESDVTRGELICPGRMAFKW